MIYFCEKSYLLLFLTTLNSDCYQSCILNTVNWNKYKEYAIRTT